MKFATVPMEPTRTRRTKESSSPYIGVLGAAEDFEVYADDVSAHGCGQGRVDDEGV
jgi:hypothetical protein